MGTTWCPSGEKSSQAGAGRHLPNAPVANRHPRLQVPVGFGSTSPATAPSHTALPVLPAQPSSSIPPVSVPQPGLFLQRPRHWHSRGGGSRELSHCQRHPPLLPTGRVRAPACPRGRMVRDVAVLPSLWHLPGRIDTIGHHQGSGGGSRAPRLRYVSKPLAPLR